MNNPEHNHMIPLIGGPCCGESITLEGVSLPNRLPMFFEGQFYIYNLEIEPREDWTSVYYQYSNSIMEVGRRISSAT
jgi:hypothetical protein